MREFIQQLASETRLTTDDVNIICTAFASQLIERVPGLKDIVNDVFESNGDVILQMHINKLVIYLQEQQCKEKFGSWIIPERKEITHREGNYPLF